MAEENKTTGDMTFWDHLEALRWTVFRSAGAVMVISIVLFCFKKFLFNIVLGPTKPDFIIYKLLGMDSGLTLINTEVTAQFMVHLKISFIGGVIIAFPYILFEVWKFVAPALYEKEKKAVRGAFCFASVLFYLGLVVGYYMVLPLMVNFFHTYSISEDVTNMINLNSYISTFSSSVLLFGLVFEFPTVVAILSRIGLVTKKMMLSGWRYAIVAVVVLAAIITPSGDLVSLAIVSLPLFILYAFSILVCKNPEPETAEEKEDE